MYTKVILKNKIFCITRMSDNASIPVDENNMDYQDYLVWLAEGGIPEELDLNAPL